MVLMKKETPARRLFSKRVDKRSRAEMTAYLAGHFRYDTLRSWNRSTSYACNMKLYNLGLDRETTDKLWDIIQVPVSAPFENVDFRRNGVSFLTGQHTGVIQP